MKAKCFYCHKLRINASKVSVFVDVLKLIKAGEIIESQKIKNYFFSVAKEISSMKASDVEDNKKVAKLK